MRINQISNEVGWMTWNIIKPIVVTFEYMLDHVNDSVNKQQLADLLAIKTSLCQLDLQ